MLNKLLIKLLNYKMNKLMFRHCNQCTNKDNCFVCNIFYKKNDIKDMIINLKGRKIRQYFIHKQCNYLCFACKYRYECDDFLGG